MTFAMKLFGSIGIVALVSMTFFFVLSRHVVSVRTENTTYLIGLASLVVLLLCLIGLALSAIWGW